MSDVIRVERDGGFARVTVDRPDRLNSLTTPDLRALADAINALGTEPVKVIVLTGSGRAFCSGADLSSTVDGDTVAAANAAVRAITRVRAVVVAAINGPAAGVGASLALACDLTLATRSAFLLMPFLPLGLVPDGGATHSVVARAGAMRANRMVLGGERIPAELAEQWGLVGEVVDDDAFGDRVQQVVDRMLDAPAAAVYETKSLLRRADRQADEALDDEWRVQARLLASADYARAREGFLQKRTVSFR